MHKYLFLFILLLLTLNACTEKETIFEKTHTNEVIDDNTAPPFNGVSSVQISNYVNKMFIDLLGREPVLDTLDLFVAELKAANFSDAAKEDLLLTLMFSSHYKSEYYNRFNDIYFTDYLARITNEDIDGAIFLFTTYYDAAMQQGETLLAEVYQQYVDQLVELKGAKSAYANKEISINEYMRRICTNFYYDEINMGAENFVISCFENFLKRLPTELEKSSGITMVEGFSAQLLLKDGNTRADFTEIILNNLGFYEGLVIDGYRLLLAREPASEEMARETETLSKDGDFQAMQRRIMLTAEYAGF